MSFISTVWPSTFLEKREILFGVLLSASIWLLPFSRSFHLVLLTFLLVAIYRAFTHRQCFKSSPATRLWLLCNACFALPILWSAFSMGESEKPLELFALQMCLLIAGFVVIDVVQNKKTMAVFHHITLWVLLFWTLDLLIQVSFGADIFGFENEPRPGIYFSSHFKFGLYYASLSPLLLFNPSVRRWPLWLKLFMSGLMLATVLFCNTRSAWLVFGFASIPWFLSLLRQGGLNNRHMVLLLMSVPLVIVLLAYASTDFQTRLMTFAPMLDGLQGVLKVIPIRSELWMNLSDVIDAHYLLGSGAGNFEKAYVAYSDVSQGPVKIYPHAHQVIVDLWVGTGLLGVFAWLLLHSVLFRQYLSASRQAKTLALPFLLVPLVTWLPFNSHRNIFGSELMQFTWIWLAMGVGLLTPSSSQADSMDGPTSD
jgi:O-antigen ligase